MTNENEKELKRQLLYEARREAIIRFGESGDILNWGKYLFPDKFSLPFCHELHNYMIETFEQELTRTLAPRGHAKCLNPETIVFGIFGVKKIKDLNVNEYVYSIDKNNKIVKQKVLAVRGEQYKKGYILKTRTGRELKLSDEHRMFTFDGYKQIEDIEIGNYIGALNCKIDNDFKINEDELKFISYMIFEGACTIKRISLGNEILVKDFTQICNNLNFNIKKVNNSSCDYTISANRTTKVLDLLKKYKIANCLVYNKNLPNEFFKMSYSQKMIFLSIMIDTDGFIDCNGLGVTLANKELIEQIQLLLASCGIVSSKKYRKNNKAGAWGLTINGKYAKQFISDGCVKLKYNKLVELLNKKRYSLYDIYPNRIKRCIKNIDNIAKKKGIRIDNNYEITREKLERLTQLFPECAEFKKQLNQDIFWDKVIEIQRIDKMEEYYDVQIENTENFIANGLISHNTTIEGFLLPMYYGIYKPMVFQHILNVQNTSSKAVNLNISMKNEFETNQMLIDIYGDMRALDEKWTETSFVLKNGVIFSCVGAGQSIRGIHYKNKRPDCIIADDLYDDEDINNSQRVEKKNRWFWSTLYPARAKSKKNAVHIQGTAISKVDLMHTGNNTKVFKIIDKEDNILWKELWSKEDIEKEKNNIGSIIFSREYMNEVRDDESSIIKEAWIQPYKQSELDQTGKKLTKICALDPACGEKALNDFSGYCMLLYDEFFNIYIQRVAEMKNSFNANMNCIDQWNERYNPSVFAIEAISGFKQLTQEVKRTKNVRLKEVTNVKDKISRLEAQSFRFENGKVFINTEMDKREYDNLVEQLINNYPVHDDVRDSVILAMEQIGKPTGIRVRRL